MDAAVADPFRELLILRRIEQDTRIGVSVALQIHLQEDAALNRGAESVLQCHARISGVSSLKREKQGTIRPNLAQESVSR